MPTYIPTVIEKTKDGEKAYDLYSILQKERIIVLDQQVTSDTSSVIMAQLLFLEYENSSKPINFYIDSPGGCVTSGLKIFDTMKNVTCPIHTYVVGNACSMGSLLASSGDKRFISKHSRHMMHMVSSGAQGQILDMEISMRETKALNESLMEIYVENTGQKKTKIKADLNRDKWLNAEKCVEYGLADEVMEYAVKTEEK